ncbi:actin [Trichinella murrelli]|uniref:Actin n=1 Tax=Trichinella murrelli TaxID=144512 RepID=A0A0V0TM88_9BILA|nr:actin [Trichinella murrelli]
MTEQHNIHLNTSYQLPDGHVIRIGSERFRCPEALFQPLLLRCLWSHVEMFVVSIMKCDLDMRRKLYENIILSGGSTMFPGMGQRMTKELRVLVVWSRPVPLYSSWLLTALFYWAVNSLSYWFCIIAH